MEISLEAALQKQSKDDIITLALEYQEKFNSTRVDINKGIGELKYIFEKLESEFLLSYFGKTVVKLVTNVVNKNVWKFLVPLKTSKTKKTLKTLQIFDKIGVNADPAKGRILSVGQYRGFNKSYYVQQDTC